MGVGVVMVMVTSAVSRLITRVKGEEGYRQRCAIAKGVFLHSGPSGRIRLALVSS